MEIAQYVALCTRLSRFVQLQTLSEDDAALLCIACGELAAFYAREEQQQSVTSSPGLLGGVSSTTMDDIVLLTMQKLLLGVVADSEPRVKEGVFLVLARVFARNASKVRAFSEPKLLGFLQSCALYLPTPDAALDRSAMSEQEKQQPASRSLQTQSEELRLHVLACLQLLLANKAPEIRLSVVASGSEQAHFFAYVVSALLHIGQHDRCRPAAQLAVETLALVLAFVGDAALLRQFFPGVSVAMWKTVDAPQQASRVAVAALRCLAQSMTLCISDAVSQSGGESDTAFTIDALRTLSQQQQQHRDGDQEASEPGVKPSADAWLDETAVNVDIILSKLFATIQKSSRKSWRVREALVELCGAVVLSCRATLRESFFRCYEELLVLRVDSIAEVAVSAQRVIGALQSELSTDEWLRMVPVLADRFQMHLTTLSLKCSTDHESVSVSIMRKLIGYVRFLGHRLGSFLDAAMDAIFAALCRVLEFDAIDIDLVLHQKYVAAVDNVDGRESGEDEREKALTTSQFQKRLRFFHEEESVRAATQLLQAIGSVSTPALFIDCAFTLLSGSSDNDAGAGGAMDDRHAEVFLVLNGFLKAYVTNPASSVDNEGSLPGSEHRESYSHSQKVDVHLVGRILEDLLVLDAWSEHSSTNNSNTRSKRHQVSQRALMVECVGVCVEILRRDFHVFLLHVLYPLVEKLGSREIEVEHAALAALHKIYFFCGYVSVEALFEANMDYFVDALCSRLERLAEFPRTALVVEALLRHTKIASLPLVDEVARSLLRSVDLHQDSPYSSSLLHALKLLLSSMTAGGEGVSKATAKPAQSTATAGGPMYRDQSGSLLTQFIKEIRILSNEGAYEDEDDEPTKIEEVSEEEEPSDEVKMKGAMPVEYDERSALDGPSEQDGDLDEQDQHSRAGKSQYTALIVEILDRSGHFLSETDPIACCLVLSLIDEGVRLLQASQTELLPLIHRLWSALLHRLAVPSKPILTATVRLVNTLAVVAGDFIGDRFVQDVWPTLRRHLSGMELLKEQQQSAHGGTRTQLTRSMLLLDIGNGSTNGSSPNEDTSETELQATEPIRHRRTQDTQLLLAALECLATVCGASSAATFIVPEVAATCTKFLDARLPPDVVSTAKVLFAALAELNGDEVFCALAPLAEWTPPPPPSSRFPGFAPLTAKSAASHANAGGARVYRENAACLLQQLVGSKSFERS